MYSFIDINEHLTNQPLPSEALNFDGKYLENEIEGYRTLYVSGRELYGSTINTKGISLIDGTHYYGRKRDARIITVGYRLVAETNADFRDAFNKMNALLSKEQAKFYFYDEPDKYFVGTVQGVDNPDPGKNAITAEFEILCTDPLKYSTTLKEFTMDSSKTINITNNGTMPASISYEISNTAKNSYIGIVSENGAMEYGDRDHVNAEKITVEDIVTFDTIKNASAKTGTGGVLYHQDYIHQGGWTMQNIVQNTPGIEFSSQYLTIDRSNIGDTNSSGWHGCLKEIPVTNTKSDFYSYWHWMFYCGAMGQTGLMYIAFYTSDNKLIAGAQVFKTDTVGNKVTYEVFAGNGTGADGHTVFMVDYQANHIHAENPFYGTWGHCDMGKVGDRLDYYWWGRKSAIIPEIKNLKLGKVQIGIFANTGRDDKLASWIGWDEINVHTWKDGLKEMPALYKAGSKITINGDKGKFYVDGKEKPQDEVLGTTYFKAEPGTTEIKVALSEGANSTVKARIREAWL